MKKQLVGAAIGAGAFALAGTQIVSRLGVASSKSGKLLALGVVIITGAVVGYTGATILNDLNNANTKSTW